MERPVDEWIGKHPKQAVPGSVDVRVKKRQGGRCAKCGRQFDLKNPGVRDHNVALKLGGEHREKNFVFLCETPCHTKIKNKEDMAKIAQVRKGEAKQYHVKKKSKHPMQGGKQSRLKKRMDGTVIDRETGRVVTPGRSKTDE